MSKELTVTPDQELLFEPKNITKETIKKYLCPKASDQELMMGLQIAKTFNLNPLKREVYFIKYSDNQPMSIVTGYEVYLKRAEGSKNWDGMEISSTGSVETHDLKGIVKVYRKDWKIPLVHEVDYSEYVQMKKNFDSGKLEPNSFWKNKPKTMIKKVAMGQGFRMAFPSEFDGMPYLQEENVIDVEANEVKADPGKSRLENIIDAEHKEVKDAPKPTTEEKPKVEKVKKAEAAKDKPTPVPASDSGKKADSVNTKEVIGIISEILTPQTVVNVKTNKPELKQVFKIDGKNYGTFDQPLAKGIVECADKKIMVKISFTERPNSDGTKIFNDITGFSQATADETTEEIWGDKTEVPI